MSATMPVRRSRPVTAPPQRLTEVVTTPRQRRARPRVIHAVVTIGGVLAIVGTQLLLSIAISGGAYQISDLQSSQRELTRQSESLSEQLEVAAATQHLADAAASLGMVPPTSTYFLDLESGAAVAAPGMPDPAGCGGACRLVPNSLTQNLPMILPATGSENPLGGVVGGAAETPTASTGIPAPVTH